MNDQGDAGNAHWGREGNARSDRGEAGVANWGHFWHAWNNAAWSSASEDEEHAWNNAAWWQAPAYPNVGRGQRLKMSKTGQRQTLLRQLRKGKRQLF